MASVYGVTGAEGITCRGESAPPYRAGSSAEPKSARPAADGAA